MSTNVRRILVAALASLAAIAALAAVTGCTEPMAQPADPSNPGTANEIVAICADVNHGAGATDGEHTLYFGGNPLSPWTAYCHDNEEYLTLPSQAAGVNVGTFQALGQSVITTYQRVRIDPTTLRVDVSDETFATTTGQLTHGSEVISSMPFGVAMACNGDPTIAQAPIDLTGTPFVVESTFTVTKTGACGWNAPRATAADPVNQLGNGWVLELAYPQ